jgi:hypothetical protein
VHFLVNDRPMRMGPLLDWSWQELARGRAYPAVGFMGDDHLPRTPEFDRVLLDSLAGDGAERWGVAWGDDLLMHDRFPTAGLLGGWMLEQMGYLVPPGFDHLNIDVAWSDLAAALGQRWYRPDVIIEHRHPAAGKAKMDPGYIANNSDVTREHDGAAYQAWHDGDRETDLAETVARIEAALPSRVLPQGGAL